MMTKEEFASVLQIFTSVIVLLTAVFQVIPPPFIVVLVLVFIFLPGLVYAIPKTHLFWALSQWIFNIHLPAVERIGFPGTKGQITKFLEWLNEQQVSPDGELDFEGSPWVPKYLREYLIRLGVMLHTKRAYEAALLKQKGKGKTKRGRRGKSSSGEILH